MTRWTAGATNLPENLCGRYAYAPQGDAQPAWHSIMNILSAFFALGIVLLAVDLLTAPKYDKTVVRANLKDTRRAA